MFFFVGAERIYRLWYYTPAALVVGSLIADRFQQRSARKRGYYLDGIIAVLCLSRPLFGWPPVSGHALFFVYALLTASSNRTRVFASLLGVITLYAKIWLWHWDMTLWPGLLAGLVTGILYRRNQTRE
jgi:hypothetical protein